jgi:hypothetical protein
MYPVAGSDEGKLIVHLDTFIFLRRGEFLLTANS